MLLRKYSSFLVFCAIFDKNYIKSYENLFLVFCAIFDKNYVKSYENLFLTHSYYETLSSVICLCIKHSFDTSRVIFFFFNITYMHVSNLIYPCILVKYKKMSQLNSYFIRVLPFTLFLSRDMSLSLSPFRCNRQILDTGRAGR
jgi:hypothetical protein